MACGRQVFWHIVDRLFMTSQITMVPRAGFGPRGQSLKNGFPKAQAQIWSPGVRGWQIIILLLAGLTLAARAASPDFSALAHSYEREARPLLVRYCLDCHDTATKKGELDLERFDTLVAVRRETGVWQHVREQLQSGEMPPEDKKQPAKEERQALLDWIEDYFHAEALAGAGDPGPVVLRRLSNAEYTYTIQDLTGVATLDPAQEFPVDSAAGEGFTNTGDALAMSPALFEKYLDAAKEIAGHAVLLPDGFRFSNKVSRRDWANGIVEQIRQFYAGVLQSGAIDFAYRSEVGAVQPENESEGRLDASRYLEALIKHRDALLEDVSLAEAIAGRERLNAKYFGLLARFFTGPPDSGNILLSQLRARWRAAQPGSGAALAQWVRGWQDQLWKFNPVGHLGGYVLDWQEPVDPVNSRRDLQIKLAPASSEVTLSLIAGSAGDGSNGDVVRWEKPRLVRPGHLPVLLRDLPAVSRSFAKFRETTLSQTAKILKAAYAAKQTEKSDTKTLAKTYDVDPTALDLCLDYLGVRTNGDTTIDEYLTLRKTNVSNQSSISGWGMDGQKHLSLLANSSDTTWHIPGEAPAHSIVVHPMPQRWVAAAWKSPLEGNVRIEAHVQDRHACGNGVRWSVEQRRGRQRRSWRAGAVDAGKAATIEPVGSARVEPGDVISLVIDSRDGNHTCDLTEIDITLVEIGGEQRRWSLSGNCADNILAGNPHADGYGNSGIWHFYTGGSENGEIARNPFPMNSLLAQWSEAGDEAEAAVLADEIQELLIKPLPAGISEADREMVAQWTQAGGPLFSRLDFNAFISGDDSGKEAAGANGLDTAHFTEDGDIIVRAPAALSFKVPRDLFAGADFLVTGMLDLSSTEGEGSVQLELTTGHVQAPEEMLAHVPVTVMPGSPGEKRVRESYDSFRECFPAAMCYARVVPIDETVTLVLYHREDEHLVRLMLDEEEKQQIDRLWEELFYVSHDAFRMEVALEQILEFATQDADPAKFTPMLEPVAKNVAALQQRLVATEPAHLESLVEFAGRAYRRPLSIDEKQGLRAFYHSLRNDDLEHEEAFRLTLARVLAAPAFLYRAEEPVAGDQQGPVSPWEQATRLSYFLWASTPDAVLSRAAAAGDLGDPDKLVSQAMRMLEDERTRRLAIQFACQWLHVRGFDHFDEKNERLYPEFASLRGSMYEETVRFFADLMQNNGSLLSILDADHTFVNADLAEFYGLPGSELPAWRRVEKLQRHGRGGILGMASVLAKQSGASRTSPILRGNWVSETLLGEKLPNPPDGVPQLPGTVPQGLSERELIERHSSQPACAKCHARIDPFGFALESFDAIGRLRADGESDTRTELVDGTQLEGIEGLRRYLMHDRRETFVRNFCRKLLGYALGRGVRLSDEPLLDEMMVRLEAEDYRFHTAIECIVRSSQFREIRGQDKEQPQSPETLP